MVVGIFASYRLYGFSWKYALGLAPITLLWPPAALSLEQLTIPILFLIALAYHWRRRSFLCGLAIGLALVTKFLPGLLILPFVIHKKFQAVLGLFTAIGLSCLIVLGLNPVAFSRYLAANSTNSPDVIASYFNGSLFSTLQRDFGIPGLLLGILFVSLLIISCRAKILGDPELKEETWLFMNYLSVAFLPIAWNYSLLPLLPLIISLIKSWKPTLILLSIAVLFLSSLLPFGGESAAFVALSILAFGISQIRLSGVSGKRFLAKN